MPAKTQRKIIIHREYCASLSEEEMTLWRSVEKTYISHRLYKEIGWAGVVRKRLGLGTLYSYFPEGQNLQLNHK